MLFENFAQISEPIGESIRLQMHVDNSKAGVLYLEIETDRAALAAATAPDTGSDIDRGALTGSDGLNVGFSHEKSRHCGVLDATGDADVLP